MTFDIQHTPTNWSAISFDKFAFRHVIPCILFGKMLFFSSLTFLYLGTLSSAAVTAKKRSRIPNQNRLIEDGQATQWPKENGQRDKQRSTKNTT
jgi:hypothetical protein